MLSPSEIQATLRANGSERRSGRYGQIHLYCASCNVERVIVFPSPIRGDGSQPGDCPRRPEHSICPNGHEMMQLSVEVVAKRSALAMQGKDSDELGNPK